MEVATTAPTCPTWLTPAPAPDQPIRSTRGDNPPVLHAFEALAGLGKLEHGVVMVDLVGDVLVFACVIPVTPESLQEFGFLKHFSPPRT
jgi:hypothetical protein